MELRIEDIYEFKHCPLKYKLMKQRGTHVEKSDNELLHDSLDSTINFFYYQLQEGYLMSLSELKEKFQSMMHQNITLDDIKMNSKRAGKKLEIRGLNILQHLHKKQSQNPDKVFATNLDFRVKVSTDPLVTIRGHIPVIRETSSGLEIVNFKYNKTTYESFRLKTDMYLTLQAMAFHQMFKKEIDYVCVENLYTGDSYYTLRKRDDYQRMFKSTRMMIEMMEKNWYFPRESFLCKDCKAKNICVEWK